MFLVALQFIAEDERLRQPRLLYSLSCAAEAAGVWSGRAWANSELGRRARCEHMAGRAWKMLPPPTYLKNGQAQTMLFLVRHLWWGRTPHKGSSTPLVPLGRTDKTECRLPRDTFIPRDIHKVALGWLWCQVGPWPSRHFSKAWWLAVGLS